ncbi:MAG: hypothetical protein ABH830_02680 [Patescibacteria group bacterium]
MNDYNIICRCGEPNCPGLIFRNHVRYLTSNACTTRNRFAIHPCSVCGRIYDEAGVALISEEYNDNEKLKKAELHKVYYIDDEVCLGEKIDVPLLQ